MCLCAASASAERVGRREVGGVTNVVHMVAAWAMVGTGGTTLVLAA